jgi:hypothetical protein
MTIAPVESGSTSSVKRKQDSNRVDFDRLCRLLKVDTWDRVFDRNLDCYSQWWNKDATEEENEKNAHEAETEHFRKYYDAVTSVAEECFPGPLIVRAPPARIEAAKPLS